MIVFLTEEESMRATLERIIPRFWPDKVVGVDWIALSFQGKTDLEKNIIPKMRGWNFGVPHFVILRDQDGGDCVILKTKLSEIAAQGGHRFTVRVVCNELESWLLGELDAVEAAYPASRAGRYRNTARFRNPDVLGSASDELSRLIDVTGKVGRAGAIASFFDPVRCTSRSFQVFWRTVKALLD